ncbi:MAG TPA: GTPase HflX [Bacteroidota bacterium]|nr:GTPase HflX [Bacteroidota bacterium]
MKFHPTSVREEAIAVGVVRKKSERTMVREQMQELVRLADTAGVEVRHTVLQERDQIDPATFIGPGKASEIGRTVTEEQLAAVIFDDDLSPVQVRNLEKIISCKIIDRSGLILDIFASRAKTKEAMTQVELAQLQYLLPRLTRQWTHLSKQYGGVGTKGPGETQIETDRRAIRRRLSVLREKLQRISKEREVQREQRRDMIRVALVGYTNAGKSTLLRHLSGADVLVEDRLFATLDTTVRMISLGPSQKVLLSDTVGFIRKLPPHLVASFRSTLAEVSEADVILHVVDAGHPHFADHIAVVNETLGELHAEGKPTIYVFNKIDTLSDRTPLREIAAAYQPSVCISAERGINIGGLETAILSILRNNVVEDSITLRQSEYGIVAKLHDIAEIVKTSYRRDSVTVRFRINRKNIGQVQQLLGRRKLPSRSAGKS